MNREQLEKNINRHALNPDFLSSELHYVLAKDEENFRFVGWSDKPGQDELKFYCFLVEQPVEHPDGTLQDEERYIITDEPLYPVIRTYHEFANIMQQLEHNTVAKAVREFPDEEIEVIKNNLQQAFGNVEKHLVKSEQGQHLLLVFDHSEVSVAANMVYFRQKAPFSDQHYQHVQEPSILR